MQSKGLKTQVLKRFRKPLITLLKKQLPTLLWSGLSGKFFALCLTNLALLLLRLKRHFLRILAS
jgi:hypothetical protein